jgi:Carboxypeptidase regulatory-like domain
MNIRTLTGGASARGVAALVFTIASIAGSIAFAQQTTGTILGTVKDQQGAVVNTAIVKATNVDTGFSRSAAANGQGEYRIDYLPVGKYNVEATAGGFERYVQKNVALDVDQELTLDIPLAVGAQTSVITVTDAPPQIDTSDAVLSKSLESDEIIGLPLVNRNIYSEISLTPGVSANSFSPTSNPNGTPNFVVGLPSAQIQINGSIDGGAPEVAFYLDGGNNITGMRNYGNPSPNPDAVEEFRVETSAFGAQYGQFSAAVVSVITKSGTNQFHGGGFTFNRNKNLNGSPWGSNTKNPYQRINFGGYIGGPVKKDKAFFFFSAAGLSQNIGQPLTGAIVPTSAERLGDFTADTFAVYTPGMPQTAANQVKGTNSSPSCQVATLNCIPSNLLDTTIANFDNVTGNTNVPGSSNFGSSIPLPSQANQVGNQPKGGQSYTGVYTQPTTENEYLGKFDENLGQKDHLAVTYFFVRTVSGPNGGGNVPWTVNQSATNQTNANVSDVHTFSSNLANQVWLTFTRAAGGRVNLPEFGPATQDLATYGSNYVLDGPPALPNISAGNFTASTTNAGPFTGSDNYELRDMVSFTKGKHSLSVGGEFALDKTMFFADLLNFGSISFATSAPTTTGNQMSDWVTGNASSFEQDSPYVTHISTWHTAAFLQDDYRITPRFTANLGIRWDIDTPPVDAHNRTESFIPGEQSTVSPNAPKGLVFPGDAGVGRGIISTKLHHVSPRLGFAWDPFGDGKTSLRGAAGIFYGTTAGNEWNQPGNAIPFALRPQNVGEGPLNSVTNLYSTPGDFPSTAPGGGLFPYTYTPSKPTFISGPGGATETISTHVQYPYTYQFNLSVQRQLPGQFTVTAAYVGTFAHDVPNFIDANYAPYSTAFGTPSTQANSIADRRQFDPCVNACPTGAAAINNGTGVLGASITYLLSNLKTNYHSLQIVANKQLSHNFRASGFYVWSRAMDTFEPDVDGQSSPQDPGYFGQPFTAANNTLGALGGGLREEYGPMNTDLRSNVAMSGIWSLDYFHGESKIVKIAANGWQIAPIAYLHSGTPFTMTTGASENFDSGGSGTNRPNAVAGVSPLLGPHRPRFGPNSTTQAWFNTAAFMNNGPGVAGGKGPGGADGNVRRNSLYGPGFRDIDLGIFRNIRFEHGIELQLRGEATNIFNVVSLNNPTANLASSNDGKITSAAGTPRVIQLGGRFTF